MEKWPACGTVIYEALIGFFCSNGTPMSAVCLYKYNSVTYLLLKYVSEKYKPPQKSLYLAENEYFSDYLDRQSCWSGVGGTIYL